MRKHTLFKYFLADTDNFKHTFFAQSKYCEAYCCHSKCRGQEYRKSVLKKSIGFKNEIQPALQNSFENDNFSNEKSHIN